jgi:rfaE bifunctional protein nucleotidyltransferase chain/domain
MPRSLKSVARAGDSHTGATGGKVGIVKLATVPSSAGSTGYRTAHDKVKSIGELAEIAEQIRKSGRTIALCHGVFDLIHFGHLRHIELARKEADVLLVTVTADQYVNKGPGRPIFPETMRAEMLGAIEVVDYVGINYAASAEPAISAIKPNVYVKGSDYENSDDDLTGKIGLERETVERHGGRLVFTKDLTFSSSGLINRYVDIYDPPLREYLERLREAEGLRRINALVDRIKNYKVVFVGDAIIDEYHYVTALGKSPKENVIATLAGEREVFAGGVFAAANHLASFCREIEVFGALGALDDHGAQIAGALRPNVKYDKVEIPGRPTTRKLRYVQPGYMRKMFEVYFMDDTPFPAAESNTLRAAVKQVCRDADLVVVTDFGHGLMDQEMVRIVCDNSRFLAVNAQSNSANLGFNLITKYPRADFACLDAPEARLAMSDRLSDISVVITDGLAKRIDCNKIIVTHGAFGCYTYDPDNGVAHIPAFTKTVVDTVGAGDAFFSVAAPFVAAGGEMDVVGFLGNAAGAIKVGIVGHRASVERTPLLKFATALLK